MFKLRHLKNFNRINTVLQVPFVTRSCTIYQKITDITNKLCSSHQLQLCRQIHVGEVVQKYNKNSKQQDDDEDSDDERTTEFKDERDSKVLKTSVNSLRADLLLKAGLGMARNKVETIFYESKVRVNGKKINKKSVQLDVGDEIDVVRGFSQANPIHLVISRVVVLDVNERDEGYSVQLRRYKSLLIENYSGPNAFKSSESVQH
ncbi:mitochondrial transcription rescue factor 1 [Bactrocera dorsalis]|uniref:Mitochondrial transcription rescue factor 1 n=1 Tax=Bactrocera dorsalis TaxID=27457 RepID=A0A6I9WB75_BACDO|nr:mitochondrial transcription rescue factor 1 [Bactrocera dorsalis]